MILKGSYLVFSVLFLIYLLWPQPYDISQFKALPNSVQSSLEGDTTQIANVKAYFSDNFRDFSINYYKNDFQDLFNLPFPAIRLNYPPEFAFTAIKDQTQSTYLEEFIYPLKGSLYVNGLEPLYEDGSPKFPGAIKFEVDDKVYFTKVTLRYYPSPIWVRVLVWAGINLSILLMWRFIKKRA